MRSLKKVAVLDQQAFDRVASAKLSGFETVMPRLTRVADHSVLWFATSAAFAATARPDLRRAALRGVIALGLASPAVNLIGKQVFRRKRPLIRLVPKVRIHRIPTSPAFPSGHSASAAAFATAVAIEAPRRVAIPIAAAAGIVGFSRIYTGAHYPGDVVAGFGCGIAAGLATRMLWPPRPGPAHVARLKVSEVSENGKGVVIVANAELDIDLPDAEIVITDDLVKDLEEAARRAKVLAVSGGDGSVGAAAEVALRHGIPLLVIPSGTLNHFAKALGIETVADAVAAYQDGCIARVDVGSVNGVPFLNTASFGAYTELVDRRERLEGRMGKWPAFAISAAKVLRRAEPVNVVIDGKRRSVWLAFIGNCAYGSRGAAPTWRDTLDDGLLDVRIVSTERPLRRARALLAILGGGLHLTPEYEHWLTPSVRLEGDYVMRIAHDGETRDVKAPVLFEKRPQRLAVFIPAPKD